MKTFRAKVFFDESGAAIDFRVHDGQRERGVVRRAADLGDRALPKPVKTYAELFAALEAMASEFTGEDIADEAVQVAAETKRQDEAKAAARAAVEAQKSRTKPTE